MDMRKDTTPTTDAATLDTIKAKDARQIDAQEPQQLTQGKKRRKDNTSREAHNRYIAKTYERMTLQLIKGDKSRLQAAAARLDISPTALIIRAVNAYTDAETLTEKAKNPYI